MSKLSICFTQSSRVSNYSSCTVWSSENICSSSGGAQAKRKDTMKLSLSPNLVEKLVWVPVTSLCKIFIPSYAFDVLLLRNWPKLVEKLVWVPVTSLCKIFIPSYAFDVLLLRNWPHDLMLMFFFWEEKGTTILSFKVDNYKFYN
jgi:hypothetical protein